MNNSKFGFKASFILGLRAIGAIFLLASFAKGLDILLGAIDLANNPWMFPVPLLIISGAIVVYGDLMQAATNAIKEDFKIKETTCTK